jgi:hypothetical protein
VGSPEACLVAQRSETHPQPLPHSGRETFEVSVQREGSQENYLSSEIRP